MQELESFILHPRKGGNSAVVRHLLLQCPACFKCLQSAGWTRERLEKLLTMSGDPERAEECTPPPYNYDRAFAKAEKTLATFLNKDRPLDEPPPEILAELFPFPDTAPATPASRENRAQIPYLIRWLVERSHSGRYRDPAKMLEWAHLARLAVDVCSSEDAGGEERLNDLKGQAWRQFGNALRVCGNLKEAEEAMSRAREHLQAGTGDPVLWAWYLQQMSSLRIYERRFEDAIKLAREAGTIQNELGDPNGVASNLVTQAIAYMYSGAGQTAIELLRKALPLIDSDEDPYLLLATRHNLIRAYLELGETRQALELYGQVQELNRQFQDPMILLRAEWQAGQLLRDLGHHEQAEAKLLRVRRDFMERGLAYEVAVVSFDLAFVYSKLGRIEEVNQIVAEAVPLLKALRIGRETLAALIQLRKASNREKSEEGPSEKTSA